MTTVAPAGVQVLGTLEQYAAVLDEARAGGRSVGFVPTMGALHAGHVALIRRAACECDTVAVSVFVNPLQFGEAADLAAYPRTPDADLAVAAGAGASVVLAPSGEEMYPVGPAAAVPSVSVAGPGRRWEGASRPGHFDGVATVVVKLLAATGRCRAYFGEKDYQQLAVVRRVVADCSLPARIVGCPTVREPDGLALSSRNVRLGRSQRSAAAVLPRALAAGARTLAADGPAAAEAAMAAVVATEPAVELEYAAVVDAGDLEPVSGPVRGRPLRLLIAARVGTVRLIDNCDPLAGP